MPTFVNTIFFKGQSSYGWSESYYTTLASISAALNELVNDLAFRRAILAKGYYIEEVRVSNVDVFRDSLVKTFSDAEGQGTYGVGAAAPAGGNEQAWDRLLCRIEAGPQVRRSYELGGIPRGVISQAGGYLGPAEWLGPFNTWVGSHVGGVGQMQIASSPGLGNSWPIQTASSAIPNPYQLTITITTPANTDLALVPGDFVRLSRSKGIGSYQGLWIVETAPVSAGGGLWTVLLAARRYLVSFPAAGARFGSVVKIAAPSYSDATAILPRRGARRKTGRPTGSPAGITPRPGR